MKNIFSKFSKKFYLVIGAIVLIFLVYIHVITTKEYKPEFKFIDPKTIDWKQSQANISEEDLEKYCIYLSMLPKLDIGDKKLMDICNEKYLKLIDEIIASSSIIK